MPTVDLDNIFLPLNYVGTYADLLATERFAGNVCRVDDITYVCTGDDWESLEPIDEKESSKPMINTCSHCGANLPLDKVNRKGICKCSYCDTFVYVYKEK